jgi:hypothetical protein
MTANDPWAMLRPTSDPGPSDEAAAGFDSRQILADMVAVDPPPVVETVFTDLLERELSGPRLAVTREERWVEDGSMAGGHWEVVS